MDIHRLRQRRRRLNPDGPNNDALTPMELHAWKVLNSMYEEWMTTHPEETQTSCANAIGYAQCNLSLYLSGTNPIRPKAAMKLAAFFKVPLTALRPDLAQMAVVEENLTLLRLLNQSISLLKEVRQETTLAALGLLEQEVEEISLRATDRARSVMNGQALYPFVQLAHT